MNIGENIRMIRVMKNYSQEYMSDQLNISQSSYSRIEKNVNQIKVSDVIEIAKVFEIQFLDVIKFNQAPFTKKK